MKKFTFSKRETNISAVALLFVLVFAFYSSAVVPYQHKKSSLGKKILEARRSIKKDQEIIARDMGFEKKYKTILTDFKQKGTDEQVMASVFSEIEEANENINVRISDKKPRKSRTPELYNQFSVSLTLEGNLADIMHFVYKLQTAPHLFRVDELRIDKRSRRSVDLRCQLTISRILIP